MIINALIHSAQQGFPDTKHYLHGHVNTVIQEKLGDPSFHVGENWVDWWLERWGKWLSTYWSSSLDTVCARALNPTIIEDYFQKVGGRLSQHSKLILTVCGQWMKPALLLGMHARPGSLDRQGTMSSSLREMVIRRLQPLCLLSLLLEHACHPVSSSKARNSTQSGQHQRTTHLNACMS